MFGKAEWFKQSQCGGICPVSLKSWLYLAAWGAIVMLPFLALGYIGKLVPEAPIWLGFSGLAFLWDMRGIQRQLEAERRRSLLYIDNEETEPAELATRNFDMKLRG